MENIKRITVQEASKILDLSEYTIKKKIREGKLNGEIKGKKYMVSVPSMLDFSIKEGKSSWCINEIQNIMNTPKVEKPNNNLYCLDTLEKTNALIDYLNLEVEIKKIEIKKIKLEKRENDKIKIFDIQIEILKIQKSINLINYYKNKKFGAL